MAKQTEKIIVEYGVCKTMAEEFGLSPITIGKVLKGIMLTSQEKYDSIRAAALTKYHGFYKPAV